jgi:peptide/nickel transport system permease protein
VSLDSPYLAGEPLGIGPAESPRDDPTAPDVSGLPAGKPRSMLRLAAAVFVQNRLAVGGLIVVILLVLFCFAGPFVYHTDQVDVNLANAGLRPGTGHPLGTDETGYDELAG